MSRFVAIIGGGRWARQIATVLGEVCAAGSHITLCSPTNPSGWLKWIEQGHSRPSAGVRYDTATQITDILHDNRITHVIVARSARDHATTSVALLNAGKSVYVEKPFALNETEAEAVSAAATGRVCMIGLVLLFASNIRRFAEAVAAIGPLQSIAVTWADTTAEHRHGEYKSYDISLNVVVDVLPHAYSLLRSMLSAPAMLLSNVSSQAGGRIVTLELKCGECVASTTLARDAPTRERIIEVTAAGGRARLDFSREPGVANINDMPLDVSTGFTSPLEAALRFFLSATPRQSETAACGPREGAQATRLAMKALESVRQSQSADIADGLSPDCCSEARQAGSYALRELVASLSPDFSQYNWDDTQLITAAENWLKGGGAGRLPPVLASDPTLLTARAALQRQRQ